MWSYDLIKESIECYINSSHDCEIMKVLMSPINYLEKLGEAQKIDINNLYTMNFANLLSNLTSVTPDLLYDNLLSSNLQKSFIKTSDLLYDYLVHIQNILFQSYISYYDVNNKMPQKLYRSVSAKELEYLTKSRKIDTLWSTTSTLDSVIGYTMEVTNHEWIPKEHFIIELTTKDKIPFVDVETCVEMGFEPNEFILVPCFTISNFKLVKEGAINFFGFYNADTIPIYSAEIQNIYDVQTIDSVSYNDIVEQFNKISVDIGKYGDMIEAYLNGNDCINLLHYHNYRLWAKNLQKLINMLQIYISEHAKSIVAGADLSKIKMLKR
ncbi:MAG: hypothetical protein J6B89_02455 [Bacilli bacterium]|nr:hypothetical protein [Bacilli bacterium]